MLDLDEGGTIDRQELLEGLGAHQTKFAFETFKVFDRNNDGGVDFVEFQNKKQRTGVRSTISESVPHNTEIYISFNYLQSLRSFLQNF